MKFGVHLSISGGMHKMARTAVALGCETVQIFSRSPRGGKAKDLRPDDVLAMRRLFKEHKIGPLIVHAPYFMNLAAKDKVKRDYSIEVLTGELVRAETLGASFVITHIGHREKDEEPEAQQSLVRVLHSIEEVLALYSGPVKLLLENTTGQGREVGSTFEALGFLIRGLPPDRVGTCFDTCHAFGQGYDLSSPRAVTAALSSFSDLVGFDSLCVLHLNDSKAALGSHKDRHEHLGLGSIGVDGFRAIINSPLFKKDMPGIMETPTDSANSDRENLKAARELRETGGNWE